MKYLLLVLLFAASIFAKDDYSFRVAYGKATASDFSEIFGGDIKKTRVDYNVAALDAGYLYDEELLGLPIDTYLKAGLAYYEQDVRKDSYEFTLYFKLYYNLDFLDNRIRIALGEGISYTTNYLEPEYDEAEMDKDNHSKVLNYLDFSIDFDFGKLIKEESLHGTNIGWAIKHRSGVFGAVNSVKEGGANYNTIYIEKNF
ncbi:MAG: hypothetical protein OQJ77_01490 [Thiovulaceae bacterium]|nr:hypothetical protein [Sulfurimonadaceae bacterium]MCW9025963.1 hypothetical protein [Sulfurimonadaceae bacterium]